jgi:hypothetical protein
VLPFMKNFILTLLVVLGCFVSTAVLAQQSIRITGQLYDTVNRRNVEYAVIMAVKVKDSTIQNFTRTDWEGKFTLEIPTDTFEIQISHPRFESRSYYIFGNAGSKDMDFGRVVLPPKGDELKEFVVFSNSQPIFFRGDTLVMVADSFKTGANANVEDLFKRLPGFQVDKSGKIVVHGKEVNKVYVDGDEFFGTDPTIATKNLPANAIENVEVYDKKVEGNATEETEKVINLTLKKDAKQGYFGKLNGASDFTNFYEGEMLVNRFKGDQKISLFGLTSNTPRNSFNWQDRNQFGLTEEMGRWEEDGSYIYEPTDRDLGVGLPNKTKTGFYYTDKFGKKIDFGVNFTYTNQNVLSVDETNTEFFIADSSYSSFANNRVFTQQESMVFNVKFIWKIDSLTKLEILPKVKQVNASTEDNSSVDFYTQERFKNRTTSNAYNEETSYLEMGGTVRLNRDFKKKFRNLKINYTLRNQSNASTDLLNNVDTDITTGFLLLQTNQRKTGNSTSIQHLGEVKFTEPITKKLRFEAKYSLQYSTGNNIKDAFDNDGTDYNLPNTFFSSNFENTSSNQRLGGRFIFATTKHEVVTGAEWNSLLINSFDVLNNNSISKPINNLLPYFKYKISFSRSKQLTFQFQTISNNPSITQLQPLPDNRNLNNIRIGNIDLTNQLTRTGSINYFTYKATTGSHTHASASYSFIENGFSQIIDYDSLGRALNKTVNVSGNERANVNFGTSIPFLKQVLKFNPSLFYNYSKLNTIINESTNQIQNHDIYIGSSVELILDSITFEVGFDYGYTYSKNSLRNSVNTFADQSYFANFEWTLPYKFKIGSAVEYVINSQRAEGFNLNFILWDASVSRMFLKKENLIISVEAKDILNQNISNSRNVFNNIIVDQKTNIIGRYIMLRAVYKFNVLKKTETDEF